GGLEVDCKTLPVKACTSVRARSGKVRSHVNRGLPALQDGSREAVTDYTATPATGTASRGGSSPRPGAAVGRRPHRGEPPDRRHARAARLPPDRREQQGFAETRARSPALARPPRVAWSSGPPPKR